jgi:small subunit ribosomal protein S8
MARKSHIGNITSSNFKLKVCELLKRAKFIADFSVVSDGNKKTLEIELLQSSLMNEVVPQIKLFSKPSRRLYTGYEDIKGVAGGRGI